MNIQPNRTDDVRHRPLPKGLQSQEVQTGEALAEKGGLCPSDEEPSCARGRG